MDSTIRPVSRDYCHDRPPARQDHISLAEGPTFQCTCNRTCYQRPPVLRDHISMANCVVFQDRFQCTNLCINNACTDYLLIILGFQTFGLNTQMFQFPNLYTHLEMKNSRSRYTWIAKPMCVPVHFKWRHDVGFSLPEALPHFLLLGCHGKSVVVFVLGIQSYKQAWGGTDSIWSFL